MNVLRLWLCFCHCPADWKSCSYWLALSRQEIVKHFALAQMEEESPNKSLNDVQPLCCDVCPNFLFYQVEMVVKPFRPPSEVVMVKNMGV